MSARKSFVYLVRRDGSVPRLLVLDSFDEPGLEVPKGAVEPEEAFSEAAAREVHEEAGIDGIRIVCALGTTRYEDEEQRFFLFEAPRGLPETFEHTVTGEGIDRGFCYRFRWVPIDETLRGKLVQGCGAFVEALIDAMGRG